METGLKEQTIAPSKAAHVDVACKEVENGAKNMDVIDGCTAGSPTKRDRVPEDSELHSLELEFARMHNTPLGDIEVVLPIEHIAPLQTLEKHEDLLALLKDEDAPEVAANNSGVCIEGEGEFEIMDIEDFSDESNQMHGSPDSHAASKPCGGRRAKLSAEQERALALEQIADIQSKTHRRKQDVKPVPVEIDFVTSAPTASGVKQNEQSGFRRARTIKKKVIFDPDVPETQKSYAQYASSNTFTAPAPPSMAANSSMKRPKPPVAIPKPIGAAPASVKVMLGNTEDMANLKRKIQAAISSNNTTAQAPSKKKRIMSEVDRLMGDEGAANMLNELNARGQKRSRTPKKEFSVPPLMGVRARKQKAKEDAMIVSRRSTASSASSITSPRRLSSSDELRTPEVQPQTKQQPTNETKFKFIRPESKSAEVPPPQALPVAKPRLAEPKKMLVTSSASSSLSTTTQNPWTDYCSPEITATAKRGIAHIAVSTKAAKIPYTFDVRLLNKLSSLLLSAFKDFSIHVVVLTSADAEFCHGIDVTSLVAETQQERAKRARMYATAIRKYLGTLANASKPIVLGISGSLRNLGITQLPLFDYVVADEACTFQSTYSELEQIPEGLYFWDNSHRELITRLFMLNERLTTADTCISKLVQKTVKVAGENNIVDAALAVAERIETNVGCRGAFIKKPVSAFFPLHAQQCEKDFKKLADIWMSLRFQNICKELF